MNGKAKEKNLRNKPRDGVTHGSAAVATALARIQLTPAEFAVAIAETERAPRPHEPALTQACVEALRRQGTRLPRVPSLRIVRVWSPNGTPLPEDWCVLTGPDECVVAAAPLPAPFVGAVAVVARAADLLDPGIDRARKKPALGDAPAMLVPDDVAVRKRWGRNPPANEPVPAGQSAMLLLVDELAVLAADLWMDGKLDHILIEQELDDVCDD